MVNLRLIVGAVAIGLICLHFHIGLFVAACAATVFWALSPAPQR